MTTTGDDFVKMQKLTEKDREETLAYLSAEPEYNIFIVGDIYNYGFADPKMDLYAQRGSDGQIVCVLMRYLDSFVLYSHCPAAVDMAEIAQRISGIDCACINGKKDVVELLIPFFPEREVKNEYLAALRTKPELRQTNTEAARLRPDQSREIIDLYTQVEEFAPAYLGHEDEETKNTRTNLEKGGRCYGMHKDGRLIATASTSAENNISAMVVGVCTHPDYRGKGYASALVSKLCCDCMDEGLSSICLFYDNPAAGRIYRRVGFVEIGQYIMLRR